MNKERGMMPVAMTQEGSLEHNSLGDLYVRHAPEGIRLAFLLTGDRTFAEDLVQEAFARLVGRLRHLRDPSAFGGYLRRTIVNQATSHFRRRKVERAYLEQKAVVRQVSGMRLEAAGDCLCVEGSPGGIVRQVSILHLPGVVEHVVGRVSKQVRDRPLAKRLALLVPGTHRLNEAVAVLGESARPLQVH